MRVIKVIVLFIIDFLFLHHALIAQVEKKVSFDFNLGLAGFSSSEHINRIGQPSNIFGNFKPGIQFGAGWNYKFSDKIYFSNALTHFGSNKSYFKLNGNLISLGLKYYPINSTHKISPYVKGGFHINFMTLRRSRYDQEFYPDSTSNTIGNGIGVTHISYHYEDLKLAGMPVKGISIGVGASVSVSPKINLFFEYMINYDNAKNVHLIKEYYPSNTSNFGYQFISGGVTIKFLKPTKQLIAALTKDQWDGDPSIKVKGTIVYKRKSKIFEKQVDVEMINSKDSLVSKIPANQVGEFTTKNIFPDDFKFMLEKPNPKIIRADLQIIHNNRLSIFDDYPPLTIVDEVETDNLISRDNNFSVVLREGFQHEVGVTALSNNISGKLSTSSIKQACKHILVFLKNKRDSIVAVAKPNDDCTFGFQDIPSGPYTLIFVSTEVDSMTTFNYHFNEPSPIIQRQFNGEKDSSLLGYIGQITAWKEDTMDVDQLLLYQDSRVVVQNKEMVVGSDSGKSVESKTNHRVIIHPNGNYEIHDSRDTSNLIKSENSNGVVDVGVQRKESSMGSKEEIKQTPSESNPKKAEISSKANSDLRKEKNIDQHSKQTVSSVDLPSGKTYDVNGNPINVYGYAVQVGAFASFENAKKLGLKVHSLTGSITYIQVLTHGNKKLYRVIVGEFKDFNSTIILQAKLKKAGYETYVRKHLETRSIKK